MNHMQKEKKRRQILGRDVEERQGGGKSQVLVAFSNTSKASMYKTAQHHQPQLVWCADAGQGGGRGVC